MVSNTYRNDSTMNLLKQHELMLVEERIFKDAFVDVVVIDEPVPQGGKINQQAQAGHDQDRRVPGNAKVWGYAG